MGFNEKVVIVTGAGSGIGAAIAIQFSEHKSKVVIVGRNADKLKKTADKCEANGAKTLTIVADLMKDEDVKKIVSTTVRHFSKIDILINNAGIAGTAAIYDENSMELYDRIISTNLRSVVLLTNLASQHLIKTKGNIINISSIAGLQVFSPGRMAYCTSKAGLDHFTRSAALDLASKGVRMNSVSPGPVKTDLFGSMCQDPAQTESYIQNLVKMTALKRISDPEEIADLVLFLASDKAKAITGSVYVTDNGALINRNLPGAD